MRKNRLLKITLLSALFVCGLCLLIKSFVAIRYASELDGGGMTLTFKGNALGENLRFDDPEEAKYFLYTHPENYNGNSLPDYIFKIPLPVYLFVFLLLLAVWLKMRYPALKKGWLAAGVILFPLLVWVAWLFQSHSPSEKVYTSDRQYSYYLEKYNYNGILETITASSPYETDYKVFVIDEVTGKKLRSGYAGGETVLRDYFGFEEDRPVRDRDRPGRIWFHFTKSDYFELPRPYDREAADAEKRRQKAIERTTRQEERRLRATADSIRWENERAEARDLFYRQRAESPITVEQVAYLQPIIRKWLDFYNIDLMQARQVEVIEDVCVTCPSDPAEDPYYWEFGPGDDSPSLVQMSYSPNRSRYVDMMISIELRDGVPHDTGEYDVDQSVYFVDRKLKRKNHLVWNGSSERVEDIFWQGNDVFVLVGFSYYNVLLFQIDVYDIPARTHKTYEALFEGDPETLQDIFGSYSNEMYLSSRGIVPYKQ